MSLFVINRYLGDEVDSSVDRSKALLEKLRKQVKDRQTQQCKEQRLKDDVKSSSDEEDTSPSRNQEHEPDIERKAKKRKKSGPENTTQKVETPISDAESGQETAEVKKTPKKRRKSVEDKNENDLEAKEMSFGKDGSSTVKKLPKKKHKTIGDQESSSQEEKPEANERTSGENSFSEVKKPRKKKKLKSIEDQESSSPEEEKAEAEDRNSLEESSFEVKKLPKKKPQSVDRDSSQEEEKPEANERTLGQGSSSKVKKQHKKKLKSTEDQESSCQEEPKPEAKDRNSGEDGLSEVKKQRKKKLKLAEDQDNGSSQDQTPKAEETTGKVRSSDAASLLLGGFDAKPLQKVLPVLPQWLAKPSLVHKDIKQNLVPINDVPGLHPKLIKKLEANKIKTFFPVQAEVIPAILESCTNGFLLGRGGYRPSDICVSAPTGSGKTLAFVIPIVQVLLQRVVCEVRALVILPTKELAQQVCKVFNIYIDGTGLKAVLVAGSKPFAGEQESLVSKKLSGFCSLADIIVCTPGRLVDHINKTEGFSLRHLRFLVIDEADRMMDSITQDWLCQVTKAVYKVDPNASSMLFARKEHAVATTANSSYCQIPLQKLLFSATLTHSPDKLQQLGLYQPRLFTSIHKQASKQRAENPEEPPTAGNFTLPEGLTHYFIPCNLNTKPLILLHFLLALRFSRVLCFTNSKEASHRLFLLVKHFGGISVAEFSSRLSPGERKKTLKEFEQGKIQLLISTDATARGIDIQGVKCVINYDAPQFIRSYIHRVGRTARAGTAGLAFTMLLNIQKQRYFNMLKEAGVPKLHKKLVTSDSLKQFEERLEEALSQLQMTIKDEQAQKRF